MNTKTLNIPFAFGTTVKATLDDGSQVDFEIVGFRNNNIILAKNLSENRVYSLQTTKAGVPNTLSFDVVGTSTKFQIDVDNEATAVESVSDSGAKQVEYNQDCTFTLTYAEGKSASDITVTGGTVSGDTLTVSNVTADATVIIADKT